MFGIGMQELAIIFVLALLIFGPKRLPELARTVGKGLAEFRRASTDLRQSFNLEADPPRPPEPTQDPRTEREPDTAPAQLADAPTGIDADGHGDLAEPEPEPEPQAVSEEPKTADGERPRD